MINNTKKTRKLFTLIAIFSLVATQCTTQAYFWPFKEKPKKTSKKKYIIAGASGLTIFGIIAAIIWGNSDQSGERISEEELYPKGGFHLKDKDKYEKIDPMRMYNEIKPKITKEQDQVKVKDHKIPTIDDNGDITYII
ncbi:MAG: hypothetical protein UR12_C0007G0011 [candidate division TM6 bacterium GW2011_GWF2_30_66]|jgi:hypothetical protein|nr:MAG: hypothetical protein UR12_C0007G0011 [candidate division TM6 bacterium GW2011_GWF2_30_66]